MQTETPRYNPFMTSTPRLLARLAPGILLLSLLPTPLLAGSPPPTVTVLDRPDTSSPNTLYTGNRPPLLPSPLIKLPIGSVRPAGWTQRMLELQADGFHGQLPNISRFLKKEGNAWLDPNGRGEFGWEEPVYWLKGFQDCAVLLNRADQIKESRIWIEAAFNSRQPDGWFGPGEERTGLATDLRGRDDLWPNMIMLFCLQSYYEQTEDPRVIDLMTRYAHYLMQVPDDRFLVGYWPKMRAGDQIHNLYWLYNRTGETKLLQLAEKVHQHAARWDRGVVNWHNVNMAQGFREPATFYQQSNLPSHLEATYKNWTHMRLAYGQVPGGMFGGDENCRAGYTGPRQAIETCGIAEEMLSDEILLAITGDLLWADRCENAAFNSMPASMTADLKALRYLTAPNQPQSDHTSKSPGIQNGGPMYHMNPHDHRCCQHNAGHAWPYYVQHLWYATPANGLAAVLYAPCSVQAAVGDGTTVSWTVDTRYPFEESALLKLQTPKSVSFPLLLRLPGWCTEPVIRLNGRRLKTDARPGAYVQIERTWNSGDEIELEFPMEVSLQSWPNNHTVSVNRGPLTYSLKIEERYVREGGTDAWPAWDIFPKSPWNYGLVLPEKDAAKAFKVIHRPWPKDNQPFEATQSPIELRARGALIPEWTLDGRGLIHEVQASPVRTSAKPERITLIPMGAARLRISAFPVIGYGPNAATWNMPQPPPVKVSHCNENDSLEALLDQQLPSSSSDQSIPRFTWWPHRGTSEWIEWTLESRQTLSGVQVYWFDDSGTGQCRIPASWKVLARQNNQWKPVANPQTDPVAVNRPNTIRFDPVTTTAIRIEVQLQADFSGGILEINALR
ncbi:MAG: beta-L-arabinofuranosidase domain-containing protein [Limisphaerales bacterium]